MRHEGTKARRHEGVNAAGAVILGMLILGGGCAKGPPIKGPYSGQTLTLAQVVEGVNANNALLPSLWAYQRFWAEIIDEKGQRHSGDGHGALMYRRPGELRVDGSTPLGPAFDLGCSAREYWLILYDQKTMWWGTKGSIGKAGARQVPIPPDLIADVLAVGPIETDYQGMPAPVTRFRFEEDAYVVRWERPGQGRIVVQKEVWYDRGTLLPRMVRLFDTSGRELLHAELSKHKAVEVEGVEKAKWPRVATEFRLTFPETRSKLTFELEEMALQYRGRPKDSNFVRPVNVDVERIEKIDEVR